MSTHEEIIDRLKALAQLDVDAVDAYGAAIQRIDLIEVRAKLLDFRADHQKHFSDLSAVIMQLGGEPPVNAPDLTGLLIQGMTAVRSMFGNEMALKALKSNEEMTGRAYAEALDLDLPNEVRKIVQKNRDDEWRHLLYVNRCISERVWSRGETSVA
jgi:rubrerythrin